MIPFNYGVYPGTSNVSIAENRRRVRTKYNENQLRHLESVFQRTQYPQVNDKEQLAKLLNLPENIIGVWFKNRRAKFRANVKFEDLKKKMNVDINSSTNFLQSNGSCKNLLINNSSENSNNIFSSSMINDINKIVNETEDENEGCVQKKTKNKKTLNKNSRINFKPPNFPASMPLIPMPSSSLEPFKTTAASMFESSCAFLPQTAAAMAAAAAATNSRSNSPSIPSSTPNLWHFSYTGMYPPTMSSQNFEKASTSFSGNELISSMTANSPFSFGNSGLMSTNYSNNSLFNMNMLASGYNLAAGTQNGVLASVNNGLNNNYHVTQPLVTMSTTSHNFSNSQLLYYHSNPASFFYNNVKQI